MTTVSMDPRIRARRVEVRKREGRRRLRFVISLAVLASTVFAAWWLVSRSPLLDVNTIEVDGATRTAVSDIISASGIRKGEPLVEVDTSGARDAIAALPWVEQVRSDRTLTGEVRFAVTERVAVAAMSGVEGWLLVDGDGRVLETLDSVTPGVVVVDGPTWQVKPGGWVSEGALPALDVASLLPVGLRSKVASVHMTDTDLELVLFGGGRIILGDATQLDDKFLAALTLLVRVDIECLEHVDVRAPSVPVLTRLADCS